MTMTRRQPSIIELPYHLTEVRSVENDTHGETTNGSGNGNGHDPGEDEEADSLPVDSLDGAVAKTHTDSSTGNAHGGRDREGVLREDQDRKSGTHFHGATYPELVFAKFLGSSE